MIYVPCVADVSAIYPTSGSNPINWFTSPITGTAGSMDRYFYGLITGATSSTT